MSFISIQEEKLYPEMFGRAPRERRCRRCGSPLREYLAGRYRCTGCRLTEHACVCERPTRASRLEVEEELAVQGVAP